jgi:molecular chaperone DnaK
MNRTTIDFGIDLGTTNSAIAVLKGITTEIIKNNRDADITPSAVWLRKNGEIYVGLEAKNRNKDHPEEAYLEFKRRMGTDHLYHFKSIGTTRKPEDLSAEVLKSLRGDAQQKMGEIVEVAVITVPAAFELHQCDATRKAAQLAGLKESPLLMEPTAASLAYFFQKEMPKGYWLVYDFGGGTFDAALMRTEEGTVQMVNHGGDNFLGGSDIDTAIVEHLLVPRLVEESGWTDFNRASAGPGGKWRQAFARLKWNAEELKIALSRRERATLETVTFMTPDGDEFEFETEVSQAEIVTVAEPFILRSVEICKRVLKEKNLSKDAVEKVILVGGPTKAPYFRDILASQLGIPLDDRVDPMTVVAHGAAVFAGTQRVNSVAHAPAVAGEFSVDLKYKPVGLDSAPIIGGKVAGTGTNDFTGFTVEIVNEKTQWRSGKISLKPEGVFIANLHAEKGEQNVYLIELFDPRGRKQKITPNRLTYTIAIGIDGGVGQPLINSMGLALANNEYARYFEKGRGLPLKATHDFKTVHALKQGQSGEVLRIPVVEGENEAADRNRLVGVLAITGNNVRRDLPAGSEVEVTLRIDTSRIVIVTAYVSFLDEEFSTKKEMVHQMPDAEELRRDCEIELKRMQELKAKAIAAQGDTARDVVDSVEVSALLDEIKNKLPAAEGNPDAAAQLEKQLQKLKQKLDEAANSLEWPALVKEARDWLNSLQRVADQYGSDQQRQKAEDLADEVEEVVRERKSERLRKKVEQTSRLYFEIVMAQTGWWVYQFQQMEKERQKMTEQGRAARLLDQGRECIAKNNVTGLQNVVRQLWDLLPREIVEQTQRGYQSGLIK